MIWRVRPGKCDCQTKPAQSRQRLLGTTRARVPAPSATMLLPKLICVFVFGQRTVQAEGLGCRVTVGVSARCTW